MYETPKIVKPYPVILAIDPGKKIGWAVLADMDGDLLMLHCGEATTWAEIAPETVDEYHISNIVIESIIPYGSALSQDVIDTCLQIGQLLEILKDRAPILVSRKEVKQHLLGRATGSDVDVRRALTDRLGEKGTKKAPGPLYRVSGHAYSALALAVLACDQLKGDKGEGKQFAKAFAGVQG